MEKTKVLFVDDDIALGQEKMYRMGKRDPATGATTQTHERDLSTVRGRNGSGDSFKEYAHDDSSSRVQ